ncbi:hypothetical protein GAJ50_07135 [Escherichia coli]|nr:hypothetical protein [Escherichia coli]
MKMFFFVLCVFFLINGFYIYPPFNSAILAPMLALLGALTLRKKITIKPFSDLLDPSFLFWFLFVSCYCLSIAVFSKTYDLSYVKNFISQLVQFAIILFSFFMLSSIDGAFSLKIEKIIVYSFVLQSVIQIAAFLYPGIADIIHLFYDKDKVERLYINYAGVRGLALTGSPGWGISVGYAISFLLFVKSFVINQKLKFSSIIVAILLLIGAMFTGRSAFIGVIFGGGYYLVSGEDITKKIKTIILFLILPALICMLTYIMLPSLSSLFGDKVFPFVFEFYYKYKDTGELSTKSTDILLNMWDLNVDVTDIVFGTGNFTNDKTGEYYFGSDVGYLRNLLYGGFFWMFTLFIYQVSLFGQLRWWKKRKDIKLFVFIFIAMLMLLEMKAMAIGYNKYVFTVSILLGLSFKERYRNAYQ